MAKESLSWGRGAGWTQEGRGLGPGSPVEQGLPSEAHRKDTFQTYGNSSTWENTVVCLGLNPSDAQASSFHPARERGLLASQRRKGMNLKTKSELLGCEKSGHFPTAPGWGGQFTKVRNARPQSGRARAGPGIAVRCSSGVCSKPSEFRVAPAS